MRQYSGRWVENLAYNVVSWRLPPSGFSGLLMLYFKRTKILESCLKDKPNLKLTNWFKSDVQSLPANPGWILTITSKQNTIGRRNNNFSFRDNPEDDSNLGNTMYFKRMNLNLPPKSVTSLTRNSAETYLTSKTIILGEKSAIFRTRCQLRTFIFELE